MNHEVLSVEPRLGVEETERRFDALQRTLPNQWKLIGSLNAYEQTMVVVPSISVDFHAPGLCPRTEDLASRSVTVGVGPAFSEADCADVAAGVQKVAHHLLR